MCISRHLASKPGRYPASTVILDSGAAILAVNSSLDDGGVRVYGSLKHVGDHPSESDCNLSLHTDAGYLK